ncbi:MULTISPECIES: alpha/beta fold hydrolase [unclassified Phyllobacterium]|uniref:alpha/beta fold hydrolase n=1 Tax=unclassified Phyllobacterium TaxID=2638441 RepID=UPI0030129FEF
MSVSDWRLPERFNFYGHSIAWGVLGNGPPAVVLHGTPFSSVVWRRIVPWLANERRIFYFDMLGYGHSDKPDADVSRGCKMSCLPLFVIIGALIYPISLPMTSVARRPCARSY